MFSKHCIQMTGRVLNSIDNKKRAAELLHRAGIPNPWRLVTLIRDAITSLQLDLSGLTVLTEAASGLYVVTPVIASLAGSKQVIALTRDSHYASADAVIAQTRALEILCDADSEIEIYTKRSLDLFAEANIVTNLGFVRPIDAETVSVMDETAVIPLMCEAWEFRPGDVDLAACRAKGIVVMGTNEDYPGLDIFSYTAWLSLKMLFDAKVEVKKSRVLLVSSDKFGTVIKNLLVTMCAHVCLIPHLREILDQEMPAFDVVFVADYSRFDLIIGEDGDISPAELAKIVPGLTAIRLAGKIDESELRQNGFYLYPDKKIGPRRMALTLSELGPRPVIELHAAGLKVGELSFRSNTSCGSTIPSSKEWLELIQPIR